MARPLAPGELYPAGHSEISERFIALATGVTARVAERGPRGGIPVVLLPGWGSPLYMYRHALDRLPDYGARAVAVDLRGFGLSDKPTHSGAYSLEMYSADLDALLDALEIGRVVLVGQSMGGGLALRYTLRHRERVAGLALINPTGLVPLPYIALARAVPRPLLAALGGRAVPRALVAAILRRLVYAHASFATERDIDEYWAPTQLDGFVYAARSALSEFDWRPLTKSESASLTQPALVILGAADRLVHNSPSDARRLPSAAVRVLQGGHCVHEEQPDATYRLMGEFIRRSAR